jgi:hypothetical protein
MVSHSLDFGLEGRETGDIADQFGILYVVHLAASPPFPKEPTAEKARIGI